MTEREERCETCRFWEDVLQAGMCRRYPPVIVEELGKPAEGELFDTEAASVYPETLADDWCGEWQPVVIAQGTKP